MKKAALILIILGCLSGLSFGANGNIGLGIIIGEPTGFIAKLWTGKTTAFDAGAAWSFVHSGTFLQIHGDFLFHNFDLFKVDTGKMALYYGFGARVKFADEAIISLRVPVGISYQFEKTAIELFLEIVPMLDIIPATEAGIGGGAGFRFFF